MKTRIIASILLAAAAIPLSHGKTFAEVAAEAKRELATVQKELEVERETIEKEKLPLARKLTELENEKIFLNKEKKIVTATAIEKRESVAPLRESVKKLTGQNEYLKNQMGSYLVNSTSKMSAIEFQKYKNLSDTVERLNSDETTSQIEILNTQIDTIEKSIARIKDLIGGTKIEGEVSISKDESTSGSYILVGPLSFFGNGIDQIGVPLEQANIANPVVFNKGFSVELIAQIDELTSTGSGLIPADMTGGDAVKILNSQESFTEHIIKGGITMIPLIGMFFVAVAVTILKIFEISSVKSPKADTLPRILDSLKAGEKQKALDLANSVSGPFGDLLIAGVEHADQEKELLEEVLYERLLAAQPKLERFISFIALTAAAAPLLGLLGTVTGMIQTFKAITVYGTGDPATLSDGISVALITTEYGLWVAVPCLIAQVLLSRIAKGKLAQMEQASVSFVNGLNA